MTVNLYMTQRLLLVVLYSRCASTFVVHVVANRVFRRRLISLLRRRHGRGRCPAADPAAEPVAAGDISLSSLPAWSRAATDGDRPQPTDGDSRKRLADDVAAAPLNH